MNIVATYGSSVTSLGATLKAEYEGAVEAAICFYDNLITNPITVNITFGYGQVGDDAITDAVGESEAEYYSYTYGQVYTAVKATDTKSGVQEAAVETLPTTDPTNGATFDIDTAEARALGLTSYSGIDGYVGINSGYDYSWKQSNVQPGTFDAVGVLEHEISEVMGRSDDAGVSNQYTLLDMFRYTAADGPATDPPGSAAGALDQPFVAGYDPNAYSYFSYNGKTVTLPYDTPAQIAAGEDVADWTDSVENDSDGFASEGQAGLVSPTDLEEMDVLGYDVSSIPPLPAVNGVLPGLASADLDAGRQLLISLAMSAAVTVSGSPSLTLNDGGAAAYDAAASTSTTLVFIYTVMAGQNTAALAVTGVGNGAAIQDGYGGSADLANAAATFSGIRIDTTPPAVTIGSLTFASATNFTFSGTASDNVSVSSVQIFSGASDLGAAVLNSATGAWSFTGTLASSGEITLAAQAADGAGNTAAATVNVYDFSGGGHSIDFGASGEIAYLSSTVGVWDAVSGSGGTVYLTSAQTSSTGGGEVLNFAGGSGDAASLYDTGSAWDLVNGSSGTVYLTGARSTVAGSGDIIDFAGGSGNAASLYDTGGVWDLVNGSGGSVYMNDAQAAVVGGGNTVYFANGAGNAVSLYSTGGVWDLVDGSGATVYLTNAQAAVAGGADTIDFGAGSGNAASLYNTGGSWDLVNGSFATIYLINAQTALVGGGDSVNFADGSGNAISIYGSAGNWDSIDGSQGSVYLNNAQAGVAGNGNTIYLYGTSAVTQSGATDAFIFQPAIGQDTINGFVSTDFMQFSASDFANWAALSSHISQSGSNTLITYDASDNITLTNVTAASLSASQFHFI